MHPPPDTGLPEFRRGDKVRIHGCTRCTHLNNKVGTLVGYQNDRCLVELLERLSAPGQAQLLALLPANLVSIQQWWMEAGAVGHPHTILDTFGGPNPLKMPPQLPRFKMYNPVPTKDEVESWWGTNIYPVMRELLQKQLCIQHPKGTLWNFCAEDGETMSKKTQDVIVYSDGARARQSQPLSMQEIQQGASLA